MQPFKEGAMKPYTKAAAVTAAKWALGLSAGFILGPFVIGLVSGTELSGNFIATKLVTGIGAFPIIFLVLWVWGLLSKKDPVTGAAIESKKETIIIPATVQNAEHHENATPGKPNKWNYVCIGAGVFMLLFLFLPEIVNGTLANIYYLGAAFWVGVIIYCSLNILRVRK
jgi:hypothetical protein